MRSCRIAVTLAVSLFTAASALASTATINFDTSTAGINCAQNRVPPLFNRPGYSTQTASYIATPTACDAGSLGVDFGNDSLLQNSSGLYLSPPYSQEVRWSWENNTDNNSWLRLITSPASGVSPAQQTPVVYLAAPASISMDILIYGVDDFGNENPAAAIELGLILRETGQSLPLGTKGSTTGSLEFVGVTGTGGSGGIPDANTPVGGVTLTQSLSWYHVEWVIVDSTHVDIYVNDPTHANPIHKSVVGLPGSGDGLLSAANNRGTLDGLAIRKPASDTLTKQWFVDVDNIAIDAPGVIDPVKVAGPISVMNTRITVTNIDPAATRVNLYRTSGGSTTLYAFATVPPADFSAGIHTFTGLVPPAVGQVITATQVIGGAESPASQAVTVTSDLMLEDFSSGVTWTRTPASGAHFREWYEVTSQCFGVGTAGTLDGSDCLKYTDSGYQNGFYSIYDAVFPATRSNYVLKAKVQIVPGSDPDAIRSYEMGAVVSGVHRDVTSASVYGSNTFACHNQALLAVDTNLAGNAIGKFPCPPCSGTYEVVTGQFAADQGDNLLVVFSTNVHDDWQSVTLEGSGVLDSLDTCEIPTGFPPVRHPVRNDQGTWNFKPDRTNTSAAWVGAYIQVDDIRLDSIPACYGTPSVTIGSVVSNNQTCVTVSAVDGSATALYVYSNVDTLIGTLASGIVAGNNTVTLTRPLMGGELVSATQVVGGIESCRATAPQKTVGDAAQVARLTLTGPLNAGATSVTVNLVDAAASVVNVYADGALIGSKNTGIVAGDNVVNVTPLVKSQSVQARQTVPVGCSGDPITSVAGVAQTVGSGHNSSVRLSLGVREVAGLTGPVGANGYNDGSPIEWIIPIDAGDATSGLKTGEAPIGHKVIPSGDWQTVTFDPTQLGTTANIVSFNLGNGVLDNTWVTIEHLAITMDQDAKDVGPFRMYVDNVKNGTEMVQDFDTTTAGVMFKTPGVSGSTAQFLLGTPNVATTDAGVFDGATGRSDRIEWCWKTEGTDTAYSWVRLTTDNQSFAPYPGGSPQIRTDVPTTMRILLPCAAPVIDVQPSPLNQTLVAGGSLIYCVSAHSVSGNPLSYQWYKGAVALADGGNISGATTSCLSINPVLEGDAGIYTCKVTDVCGTITTESLTMAVCTPPTLAGSWPTPQTVSPGNTVTLVAHMIGTEPIYYQWRKGGVNLVDGGKFSGATSDTLTIINFQIEDAGTYECLGINACGSLVVPFPINVQFEDPVILAWRSLKTHSGFGEVAITLNAAATATGATAGGIKVESRNSTAQNGLTKIQVDFNMPVSVLDPSQVTVTGLSTSGCNSAGQNCVSAVKTVTPAPTVTMVSPQTMQIAFTSGSAAGDSCYIITIGPGALNVVLFGDNNCKVRMLQSDSTGDGLVALADLSQIKSRFNQAVTATNCSSDQNLAAGIGLADISQTKSRFGRRALCP